MFNYFNVDIIKRGSYLGVKYLQVEQAQLQFSLICHAQKHLLRLTYYKSKLFTIAWM